LNLQQNYSANLISHTAKHKLGPWTWTDPLVRPKQWKGVIKLGTWSVRSL